MDAGDAPPPANPLTPNPNNPDNPNHTAGSPSWASSSTTT